MTRRRSPVCRCCGALAASAYCDQCGTHLVQRAAIVQAAVAAIWGTAGVTKFQTEMRARRLVARRTAKPGRKSA